LLAYTSFRGTLDVVGATADGLPDVYSISPDGRRPTRVSRTMAWESDVAWSPDGRRLAYARGDEPAEHAGSFQSPGFETTIWVSKADGTDARRVTFSDPDEPTVDASPVWSPDGGRLAFQRSSFDERFPHGIYVTSLGKRSVRVVAPGFWSLIEWSPDGTTVVAAREGRVRLIDLETGNVRAADALPAGANDVDYSPDRLSAALARDTGVYVLRLADGRLRRVARARDVGTVSWSPDGRTIAFTASGPEDRDVFVVNRDGAKLRRLTGEGHESSVAYRP
jgi:Tol biopolymer transport system component